MDRKMVGWFSAALCLLPMAACADMAYPRGSAAQRELFLLLLWCVAMPWAFFFFLFKRRGMSGILSFIFGFLMVVVLAMLFVGIHSYVFDSRWGDRDVMPFLTWCIALWAILYPFFWKTTRPLRALFLSLLADILFVLLYFGGMILIVCTW